jgi:hypothetical protein
MTKRPIKSGYKVCLKYFQNKKPSQRAVAVKQPELKTA